MEIRPPRSQTIRKSAALPLWLATMEGALKMPAPMTVPRIRQTTSSVERVGLGPSLECMVPCSVGDDRELFM